MKKILMILCLTVGLAGCANSPFAAKSDQKYDKSPCACLDEIEFINGVAAIKRDV